MMIYKSEETEKNAAMRVAELMTAAARTAPKACGVDAIETIVLDGGDKEKLTAAMRELGGGNEGSFYVRDAGNVDACHCVVLVGVSAKPRGLDCSLCGVKDCSAASRDSIPCALAVNDLGIAVGSAASVAMDHRIDNRIMFTAGMAALKLRLLPEDFGICFGIPLATSGKNIFFDRALR